MRFGLCCLFNREPVAFRTTTAKALLPLPVTARFAKISEICRHNSASLIQAVETVDRLGIGAFRIMSPLFPRMTHPAVGYSLSDLPVAAEIEADLEKVRVFARNRNIRLSFHPDQFVVISSPHAAVVENSVRELEYQGWLAEKVGAEMINLHAGGAYGDKQGTLDRLQKVVCRLPASVRSRITLENDDVSYTVNDLLPVCRELGIPLVYDLHHHRCNPDGLTIEHATELAGETWRAADREQYCHISSPKNGWGEGNTRPHSDFIDVTDFPECWIGREMTVDVEAKAKELAVLRLMDDYSVLLKKCRRSYSAG